MCLFSFHIKVTGLKCLQEDATISQVSWEYILQCNIGEVRGTRFSDSACACPPPGSTPPAGSTDSAGGQTALILSCLSVCLRTDSHTQPPRQTNGGQAAATPGARRVSEAWGGEACGPAVLAQRSPARRPLCSGRRGLPKGGDVWAQVCREPHPDPVRLVADDKVDGAQTPWAAGWVLRPKHC